ncbi:MAG: four helix bundle protein [Flavisolibacter sp.]
MGDYKDLKAFQKAYKLAMDIFNISKDFPTEEKYSLTNQIRKSSRSVCANFAEAYRKRKYRAHFLSKLSDCETENTETEVWIDFSKDCCYISPEKHQDLFQRNSEVGKMIFHMINNPDRYL